MNAPNIGTNRSAPVTPSKDAATGRGLEGAARGESSAPAIAPANATTAPITQAQAETAIQAQPGANANRAIDTAQVDYGKLENVIASVNPEQPLTPSATEEIFSSIEGINTAGSDFGDLAQGGIGGDSALGAWGSAGASFA